MADKNTNETPFGGVIPVHAQSNNRGGLTSGEDIEKFFAPKAPETDKNRETIATESSLKEIKTKIVEVGFAPINKRADILRELQDNLDSMENTDSEEYRNLQGQINKFGEMVEKQSINLGFDLINVSTDTTLSEVKKGLIQNLTPTNAEEVGLTQPKSDLEIFQHKQAIKSIEQFERSVEDLVSIGNDDSYLDDMIIMSQNDIERDEDGTSISKKTKILELLAYKEAKAKREKYDNDISWIGSFLDQAVGKNDDAAKRIALISIDDYLEKYSDSPYVQARVKELKQKYGLEVQLQSDLTTTKMNTTNESPDPANNQQVGSLEELIVPTNVDQYQRDISALREEIASENNPETKRELEYQLRGLEVELENYRRDNSGANVDDYQGINGDYQRTLDRRLEELERETNSITREDIKTEIAQLQNKIRQNEEAEKRKSEEPVVRPRVFVRDKDAKTPENDELYRNVNDGIIEEGGNSRLVVDNILVATEEYAALQEKVKKGMPLTDRDQKIQKYMKNYEGVGNNPIVGETVKIGNGGEAARDVNKPKSSAVTPPPEGTLPEVIIAPDGRYVINDQVVTQERLDEVRLKMNEFKRQIEEKRSSDITLDPVERAILNKDRLMFDPNNQYRDKKGQELDPVDERKYRIENAGDIKLRRMIEVAERYEKERTQNELDIFKEDARIRELTEDPESLAPVDIPNPLVIRLNEQKSAQEKSKGELLEKKRQIEEKYNGPLNKFNRARGGNKEFQDINKQLAMLDSSIADKTAQIAELPQTVKGPANIPMLVQEAKQKRVELMLKRPNIKSEFDQISMSFNDQMKDLNNALQNGQIDQNQFDRQRQIIIQNTTAEQQKFIDSLVTRTPEINDYDDVIIAEEERLLEDSGETKKPYRIRELKSKLGELLKGHEKLAKDGQLTPEGLNKFEELIKLGRRAGWEKSPEELMAILNEAEKDKISIEEVAKRHGIPENRISLYKQDSVGNADWRYKLRENILQKQLDNGDIDRAEYERKLKELGKEAPNLLDNLVNPNVRSASNENAAGGNPLAGGQGQVGGTPNNLNQNLNKVPQNTGENRLYAKFVARNAVAERGFGRKPGFEDDYEGGNLDVATVAGRQGLNGKTTLNNYLSALDSELEVLSADDLKNRTEGRMSMYGKKIVNAAVPAGVGLLVREGIKMGGMSMGLEHLGGPMVAGVVGAVTGGIGKWMEVRDLSTENADEFFQRQIKPEAKGIWGGIQRWVMNPLQTWAVQKTFLPFKRATEINGFLDLAGGVNANFDNLKDLYAKDQGRYEKFVADMFTQAALTGFSESGDPTRQAAMREKLMLAVAVMEDAGKVTELNNIYSNANQYAAGQIEKVKGRVSWGAAGDRAVKAFLMAGAAQFVTDRIQDLMNPPVSGLGNPTALQAQIDALNAQRADLVAQNGMSIPGTTTTIPGGPIDANAIIRGVLADPNSPVRNFGGNVDIYLNNAADRSAWISSAQDIANEITAGRIDMSALNAVAAQHGMTPEQALMGIIMRDNYDPRNAAQLIADLSRNDSGTWNSITQGFGALAQNGNNPDGLLTNNYWAQGFSQVINNAMTGATTTVTTAATTLDTSAAIAALDGQLGGLTGQLSAIGAERFANAAMNITQAALAGAAMIGTALLDVPGEVNYGTKLDKNPDAKLNQGPAAKQANGATTAPVQGAAATTPAGVNNGNGGKPAVAKTGEEPNKGIKLGETVTPADNKTATNAAQQPNTAANVTPEQSKVKLRQTPQGPGVNEDESVTSIANDGATELMARNDESVLLPTGDNEKGGELLNPLQGLKVGTDRTPNYVRLNLGGVGTPEATYRVDKINEVKDDKGEAINLKDSTIVLTQYDENGLPIIGTSLKISYEEYRRAVGLDNKIEEEKDGSSANAATPPTGTQGDDDDEGDKDKVLTMNNMVEMQNNGTELTDADGNSFTISIDEETGLISGNYANGVVKTYTPEAIAGFLGKQIVEGAETTIFPKDEVNDEEETGETPKFVKYSNLLDQARNLEEGKTIRLVSNDGYEYDATGVTEDNQIILRDRNNKISVVDNEVFRRLLLLEPKAKLLGLNRDLNSKKIIPVDTDEFGDPEEEDINLNRNKEEDEIELEAQNIEGTYQVEKLASQLNTLILELGKQIDKLTDTPKGRTSSVGTPSSLRGGAYQSVQSVPVNGNRPLLEKIAEEEGGQEVPRFTPQVEIGNVGKSISYVNLGVLLTTEVLPRLDAEQKEDFAQWLNSNKGEVTIKSINEKIDGYSISLPQYQPYFKEVDPTAQTLILEDNNRKVGIENIANNPELSEEAKKDLIANEFSAMRIQKGQSIKDFDSIENEEDRKAKYREWDWLQAEKIIESYKPKEPKK